MSQRQSRFASLADVPGTYTVRHKAITSGPPIPRVPFALHSLVAVIGPTGERTGLPCLDPSAEVGRPLMTFPPPAAARARCRWGTHRRWRRSGHERSAPSRTGPCRTRAVPRASRAMRESRAGHGGSRRTPCARHCRHAERAHTHRLGMLPAAPLPGRPGGFDRPRPTFHRAVLGNERKRRGEGGGVEEGTARSRTGA